MSQLSGPSLRQQQNLQVGATMYDPDVLCVYDEEIAIRTAPDVSVVGVGVGIANFLTTSTGRHYGTMDGDFRKRHKRDCAKCRLNE